MKRLPVIILILCLLATTGAACAGGTHDLSGCSDSELIALLADVQSEIVARKIEKTARLTAGSYTGGRDIPVGAYILAADGSEKESGIVSLSSVNDQANHYPSKLYEYKRGGEDYSVFITIEEGDTLTIPFPYTLTISCGVMFE